VRKPKYTNISSSPFLHISVHTRTHTHTHTHTERERDIYIYIIPKWVVKHEGFRPGVALKREGIKGGSDLQMELMVKEGNGRSLEREVAQEMRFEDSFFIRYRLPRTAGGGSGMEELFPAALPCRAAKIPGEQSTLMKEIQVAKVRGLQRRKPLTYS